MKTIVNNKYVALKIAHGFAMSREVKERGFWKDPEFGETVDDKEGKFFTFFLNLKLTTFRYAEYL